MYLGGLSSVAELVQTVIDVSGKEIYRIRRGAGEHAIAEL